MKTIEIKAPSVNRYRINLLQAVMDSYNVNATVLASEQEDSFKLAFENDEDATHFTLTLDLKTLDKDYLRLWWGSIMGTMA